MKKRQNQEAIIEIQNTFNKYKEVVGDVALLKFCGKVKEVRGSLIVSEGPFAKIGDMCRIYKNGGSHVDCEVIGIKNQDVFIASYGWNNFWRYGLFLRQSFINNVFG